MIERLKKLEKRWSQRQKLKCPELQPRYWLAINGPTAAASAIPFGRVQVSPIPEQLIGYSTREEQIAAQNMCLHEPLEKVQEYFGQILPARIESGDVLYYRFTDSEPYTNGPTMWMATT